LLAGIDVLLHHVPGFIDEVAIQVRNVILALLDHSIATRRRLETFPATRDRRLSDNVSPFVEEGPLAS
jgi:hypothetical protein